MITCKGCLNYGYKTKGVCRVRGPRKPDCEICKMFVPNEYGGVPRFARFCQSPTMMAELLVADVEFGVNNWVFLIDGASFDSEEKATAYAIKWLCEPSEDDEIKGED